MADADDALRTRLVALAQATRDKADLPPGFNAVVVVTDDEGAWCGVSSTADDGYTARLLNAALRGAAFRRHAIAPEPADG